MSYFKIYLPVIIAVLFFSFCTDRYLQEHASSSSQKVQRPVAFENSKFFTRDGQRMLYGGRKDNQHFNVDNLSLNERQFHYGLGREAFPALL